MGVGSIGVKKGLLTATTGWTYFKRLCRYCKEYKVSFDIMRIDLDDVFSALRQLGKTVGDLEMQEKCQETNQTMQENVNPRLVQEKRLKKRAMEPLKEPLEMRELNVQMREMKLEMREILEIERKEMAKKMQEMQEMYQEKYQEMYQEMQELKLKVQAMTKNMQENVNPRTALDHHITRSEGELQLLFVNELHDAIFTMDKIRDRHGGYVKIKLINTANDGLTVKKGHLSSTEIEIVVLEGDFGFGGNENWTNEEFNAKIIYTKTGSKLPLVKGKVKIKLTDGVGTIEDLSFSDNSNCTSSKKSLYGKKFRLGARAIGLGMGVRIKEARSEAFAVRHHRAKETHLKKIENDGKFHATLIAHGILTKSDVKLKHMYEKNPDELRREIFKGCSNNEWDAFVQHIIRIVDDANSNHLRIQEAEAIYNTGTTGPPLHQGMQNNSNCASSSQQPENLQEPQAMSTSPTQVRAQLVHSIDIHQPPNNGDSFCPLSTYHMAQSAAPHLQNDLRCFLYGSYDPMNESNDHGYFEKEPANYII
ncbi:hypothetical protein LWI28_000738 [Acer negundo]|uniref:Uncharacterized protein n=1 Tax=Acer negundo TaxID=4023 RepID=A0AAD5J3U4_ACENE|nr:hypothetical protein LWI28_000738 [Acer negundo]